jgi:hypothetical protein
MIDNKTISTNAISYRQLFNGTKYIEIGSFGQSTVKVRYHIEKIHDNLNIMRIDVNDLRFANFSFPSNSTNLETNITQNWIRANWIMGGDPYVTYETNLISELTEY